MKIAIPTNDRKTVAAKSGRAKEFVVVEFTNKEKVSEIYLSNNHDLAYHSNVNKDGKVFNYNGGNPNHGHDNLVELLEGVEVVIGKKFGPHFSRDFHTAGVKLILTKLDSIDEALQSIES